MQTIANHTEASMAMTGFLVAPGTGLPDGLLDKVRSYMVGSPVDQYVKVSETLYAAKAGLNNEARDLCGALAAFCADNGWHQMSDRGLAMKKAMQRDMGETAPAAGWPAESDDPAALPEYVLVAPVVSQATATTDEKA